MLAGMKVPLGLNALPWGWAPRSGKSGSGGSTGAARLQRALPTLQRNPAQLRSLLVHALDLQTVRQGRGKACAELGCGC